MWEPLSLLVLLLLSPSVIPASAAENSTGKLLYILLDGFRYDYLDDIAPEELPGFNYFLSNGVRARWVNPLYPTLSFPTWTTLSTGLYAESHNIVGNYFYDTKDEDYFAIFDSDANGKKKWWTAEPIWATAKKAGLRTALFLWSRCDVKFDGEVPDFCLKFEKIPGPEIFRENIDKALDKFDEGFDFVQVYTEHLDGTGHMMGPESEERKQATKDIDRILVHLQKQLIERGLAGEVNIVIVSDHGMTSMVEKDVTYIQLDDYLPEEANIESIADRGAYVNIKVKQPEDVDKVYASLSTMKGVSVYKKAEIPEEWHLKNSKYIHDILLLADINYYINSSVREAQIPAKTNNTPVFKGAHGYSPKEMKMKSIFFAKGPAFKTNTVLEPIDIVDIYGVLTKTLNIEGLPYNGTFENVRGAFVDASAGQLATGVTLPLLLLMLMTSCNNFFDGF
uniref:Ectonucleotide pyrophosphatase/phosphodiesterase family member 6 n=1 Tax=Hirondellea gigas TaxID=1518452 RepID=A0A2P2HZS3_9CRUS